MGGSVTDPSGALESPEVPERIEFIEGLNLIFDLTDPAYVLSGAVSDVLFFITGAKNPFDLIREQLRGDWEGLDKAGVAIGHLGEFDGFLNQNLFEAESAMFAHWEGNAAAAAKGYFDGLRGTLGKNEELLRSISAAYDSVVYTIISLSTIIVTGLETLIDLVIGAVAAAAEGLATEPESGPLGPGIAVVAFALIATAATAKWLNITEKVAKAADVVNGFFLAVSQADLGVKQTLNLPLPKAAYDDPQV